MMTPELKAQALAVIAEMLDDPTLECSISCGTKRIDKPDSAWMEFAQTKGWTIVLSVKGGARDLDHKGNEVPTISRRPLEERIELAHRRSE